MLVGALLWPTPAVLAGEDADPAAMHVPAAPAHADVQTIVDELRTRLAIRHVVIVELVPANARLVSVARSAENAEEFRLLVEDGFYATLSAEERQAAVAHELGHVWIFTNHPYLQTEQLANRIAMRVVSRDSLASLYTKMWARGGLDGDLTRLLGEAASVQAAETADR
jgi:hypothetical protein